MQTVKMHFAFAEANCMQVVNKTNIQDENDHQHEASCEAPLQVTLCIMTLKHALNLDKIMVSKCHVIRSLQIFQVADYHLELFLCGLFLCGFLHTHTALLTSAEFSVGAEICQPCIQPRWIQR